MTAQALQPHNCSAQNNSFLFSVIAARDMPRLYASAHPVSYETLPFNPHYMQFTEPLSLMLTLR